MMQPDALDQRILAEIEDGLPLVSEPYAAVAQALGVDEAEIITRLERLVHSGIVKRLGFVVRHRTVGFTANAMIVWDVDDAKVDALAALAAEAPFVTLCYRRPRRLPLWPYNLFCMIHGRDRTTVSAQIDDLNATTGLGAYPTTVLFSRRCFKQRGARFSKPEEHAA